LESLDELGIELINEDEAESRLAASGELDDEPDDLVDEPDDDDEGELTPEDSTRSPGGSTILCGCT